MFEGASYYADKVDTTMLIIVGISVFFLIGIVAAMIYFVVRYNHKRNPVATQIKGNNLLEAIWIIIPLFIVIGMFWLGWKDFSRLRKITDYAMKIEVTGRMWKWDFKYPNGKTSDTLYVPVGKTIKLEMRSVDVNHAFFIPALRMKEDVIASRNTYMIIEPQKLGEYDIACAEYCGLNHAYMYTKLIVVPEDVFDAWLSGDSTVPSAATPTPTIAKIEPKNENEYIKLIRNNKNFDLLVKYACVSCHTVDGSKHIGPSFAKLASGKTDVMRDGKKMTIDIDAKYLRTALLEPDYEIVEGYSPYTMPTLRGRVSENDLQAIIELLLGKN